MSNQHNFPNKKNQQGFTLIELLVVVSVLAAMAGIAAVAMDGYEQDAQEQLVQTEMKRIASAIYRFKEDTGYFPKEGIFSGDALFGSDAGSQKTLYNHVENLSWLFNSPQVLDSNGDDKVDGADTPYERLSWNENSGRGWHGPYLTIGSQRRLSSEDCDLAVLDVDKSYLGLTDPFERQTSYNSLSVCSIVLDEGNWITRESSGRAYGYFTAYNNNAVEDCKDTGNGCIALVSAGTDSELDTDLTDGVTNDIVHILRVNP
ncbi:type II secretion system protein [Neptuniibacter sp. QD72_48]|uniref:type II secretion system protein n=1 Tax=unclassified Neptuniibacter TaxID=2630693 RepID=UPI0039F5D3AF